ncbi:outer membrane protein assembly factor BamB family protein [Dictyobacter alpinus]|uniref:outer membrane protein assembly factor BamB family protein n=1 Tax=Dictyobacter alpinus TaxID=2014873 RepID=UPI0035315ED4
MSTDCAGSGEVSPPLCVLDVLTGKVLWQSKLLDRSYMIGSGLVIASSSDNSLTALHLETGKIAWKIPLVPACTSSQASNIKVLNDTTLFCGDRHGITALSLATGKITLDWSYPNQTIMIYPDQTSLLVALQKSYRQGNEGGKLIKVNAADGRILWEHAQSGFAGGTLNQGNLYFLRHKTGGFELAALRMSDGQSLWHDTSCDNAPPSTGTQKTTERCYWPEPNTSVQVNYHNGSGSLFDS